MLCCRCRLVYICGLLAFFLFFCCIILSHSLLFATLAFLVHLPIQHHTFMLSLMSTSCILPHNITTLLPKCTNGIAQSNHHHLHQSRRMFIFVQRLYLSIVKTDKSSYCVWSLLYHFIYFSPISMLLFLLHPHQNIMRIWRCL